MAQTLLAWFGNSAIRRGELKSVLPYEDQPDQNDSDHPSAFERLTGGSRRRNTYRLPAVPIRGPDHAYSCGINGVEDEMLDMLDNEGDDEVIWNPKAVDLTEVAKVERGGRADTASDAWTMIEKGLAVLVGYSNGEPIIKMKPSPRKPAPARRLQLTQPTKKLRQQARPTNRPTAPRQAVAKANVATDSRPQIEPACPLDWNDLVLPNIVPRG